MELNDDIKLTTSIKKVEKKKYITRMTTIVRATSQFILESFFYLIYGYILKI